MLKIQPPYNFYRANLYKLEIFFSIIANVYHYYGMLQEVQSSNGLIHANIPYNDIRHADILRSIKHYHSGKIIMKFRIGSFKLSSVNDKWWFYFLRGLK